MPVTTFKQSPVKVDLGGLGTITAARLTPKSAKGPTCTYVGGLPYALPPTGAYRFRRPRPLPDGYSYGTKANPGSFTGRTALCPQPSYRGVPEKSLWDENCLQLNIWIPHGPPPSHRGWPVFFFIHGGWLQFGTANMAPSTMANMFHETPFKAIFIMPAYRLNLFGFLTSRELEAEAERDGETPGNCGFWDQRMALEWVAKNIHLLGGDAKKVTVGGYSAGSHSTFNQLAHDLDRPEGEQLIGRAIMWSNGPGVQAKGLAESQDQFDELLGHLGISLDLNSAEKLHKLRAVPADRLVEVQSKMKISEFRAWSDGDFVSKTTSQSINDGTFAIKLKRRGIKILNGECAEEWNMYASWRTPENTYEDVYRRLVADYPEKAVRALVPIYFPNEQLPSRYKDWQDAFGKVYADMQVYALERGFAHCLDAGGFKVGQDLLRYRIEWRAKCVDTQLPPEWGVTHSSDTAIWFWGNGMGKGLTDEEKVVVAPINQLLTDFVNFGNVEWPVKVTRGVLRLTARGKVDMWVDELYDHGLEVWKAVTVEEGAGPRL
ncbi:Secreted lipase [Sphaceloma murrayae]|uniref:Secreted lipase n=1 Tax=Sphaceloma murrayae TaxID=2082308 RepID=A0A2K1QW14_9PEZI|nr:Secreted lipase [Sphaceloma murrayae]